MLYSRGEPIPESGNRSVLGRGSGVVEEAAIEKLGHSLKTRDALQ